MSQEEVAMQHHAVVQSKFETIPTGLVVATLVNHGGMHRTDAMRAARAARGILAERLTADQALAVAAEFNRHGFQTRSVSAEKLPARSKRRQLRWFEIEETGLLAPFKTSGETVRIPWSSVFVISAGVIAELRETERLESREVIFGYRDETSWTDYEFTTEKNSEMVHVTELIGLTDAGKLQYYRLPARGMNYHRVLGADAAKFGFFDNYLRMVQTLVERSSTALVSPETKELLADRKKANETRIGEHHVLVEEDKFIQYNRWLLQMVVFQEMDANQQE